MIFPGEPGILARCQGIRSAISACRSGTLRTLECGTALPEKSSGEPFSDEPGNDQGPEKLPPPGMTRACQRVPFGQRRSLVPAH